MYEMKIIATSAATKRWWAALTQIKKKGERP